MYNKAHYYVYFQNLMWSMDFTLICMFAYILLLLRMYMKICPALDHHSSIIFSVEFSTSIVYDILGLWTRSYFSLNAMLGNS